MYLKNDTSIYSHLSDTGVQDPTDVHVEQEALRLRKL